jgi:hypothetical protein
VLEVGPDDRSCHLRPQGDAPSTLVLEVVHLLAHHVGRFTDPLEDGQILEQGCEGQPVAGPLYGA